MHRERAFTIIELMIAVALTGILLSMAVPALSSFTQNSRQTGAINDLVSTIHLARSTAITTNSRVTVCTSSSGNDCELVAWDQGWIAFSDANSDQSVNLGETIHSAGAGVEELGIQSGDFAQFLMYRPNGRAMNASVNTNSGEFTICDQRGDDYAKVLIIDLSGRPRVSKHKIDGSSPTCP